MDKKYLEEILKAVQSGEQSIGDAMEKLRRLPYEALDEYARIDHHRNIRRGLPEVIYGEGKTAEQLAAIFNRMAEHSLQVLATRVSKEQYDLAAQHLPEGVVYDPETRLLYLDREQNRQLLEGVLVMAAGTSDIPVAQEAALTAELFGHSVRRVYDVGVAGLHRLLDHLDALHEANVIIVAAGMEGALPSVVAGLVQVPVVAVPTSVGYGASFNGLSALLAMMNSCANGVAVVNIDNGFGAGSYAAMINRLVHRHSVDKLGAKR